MEIFVFPFYRNIILLKYLFFPLFTVSSVNILQYIYMLVYITFNVDTWYVEYSKLCILSILSLHLYCLFVICNMKNIVINSSDAVVHKVN